MTEQPTDPVDVEPDSESPSDAAASDSASAAAAASDSESGSEGGPAPAPAPVAPPPLELRVAEVVEAGEHPNADRLLVLRIDLGTERRQLVAGLAGIYEPESLVGKRIVVVSNLKPAKLRGEVSEGMLLAAHGEDAVGLLLAPDAEPGTRVAAGPGGSLEATGDAAETESEITIDDFAAHIIGASPEGVTIDGRRVEEPRLVVDRDAWGKVK
jgi:methionine--tRNA ligase beta chain